MPQLTFCLEIEKGCDVISSCRSETIEPFQKKIKKGRAGSLRVVSVIGMYVVTSCMMMLFMGLLEVNVWLNDFCYLKPKAWGAASARVSESCRK